MTREELNAPRTDLFCEFCQKQCKSLNSYTQHKTRCRNNPERKAFDQLGAYSRALKGETKFTSDKVAKCAKSLKDKYASGYVSPLKDKKVQFDYLYEEHNDLEIQKWLDYIRSKDIDIEELQTVDHSEGYKIVSRGQYIVGNSVKLVFEHDYIANILLDGKLIDENAVHHINKQRDDNSIYNLMVFDTKASHCRFHNSKYAYLEYDSNSHIFTCELQKC